MAIDFDGGSLVEALSCDGTFSVTINLKNGAGVAQAGIIIRFTASEFATDPKLSVPNTSDITVSGTTDTQAVVEAQANAEFGLEVAGKLAAPCTSAEFTIDLQNGNDFDWVVGPTGFQVVPPQAVPVPPHADGTFAYEVFLQCCAGDANSTAVVAQSATGSDNVTGVNIVLDPANGAVGCPHAAGRDAEAAVTGRLVDKTKKGVVALDITRRTAQGDSKTCKNLTEIDHVHDGNCSLTVPEEGFVSAGSFEGGAVAPGEIISLFGECLGPIFGLQTRFGRDGLLVNRIGGTQLLVDGEPSPLFYVSTGQINAQIPYSAAGKQAVSVQVLAGSSESAPIELPVQRARPALFTVGAQSLRAIAVGLDGQLNGPENPAASGDVLVFYGTGGGPLQTEVATGAPAPSDPPVLLSDPVGLWIGEQRAEVTFAGAAPNFVGLIQLNVVVPRLETSAEDLPVTWRVGKVTSSSHPTISVRPD